MEQILLKTLIVVQPHLLRNRRVHWHHHKSWHLIPIPSQTYPIHTPTPCFFKNYFNIRAIFHLRVGLPKWSLPFTFFDYIFMWWLISSMLHAPSISLSLILNSTNFESPLYAVLSVLLLLPLSSVQIFSSAFCQMPSILFFPCGDRPSFLLKQKNRQTFSLYLLPIIFTCLDRRW